MEIITQTTEALYNTEGLWTWIIVSAAVVFCAAYLIISSWEGRLAIEWTAIALLPTVAVGGIVFAVAGIAYKIDYTNANRTHIQQALIECGYIGPSTGQGKWIAYLDKVEVEGTYNFVGSDIYILGEHGCTE